MKKKAYLSLALVCVMLFGFVSQTVCHAREFLFDQLVTKTVVMYLNKSNVLVYGEKQYMSEDRAVMPYEENSTIMMPVSFFADTMSGRVTIEDARATVTIDDKTEVFAAVKGPGNVDYVVLSELCAAFGLNLHVEKNGLVAYSEQDMSVYFDWAQYTHKMRDMIESFVYDDVTGEELYNLLVANNPNQEHPRIAMTAEKLETIRSEIRSENGDKVYKQLYAQVLDEADNYLNRKVSVHELRDGIRLLYVSQEALQRIQACAMAYLLSEDEKYAQCAYAELKAVCAFKDWNPRHFLDVGVMSMAVAYGYDWLYHWMTEDQRATIRDAAKRLAMDAVMDDINGTGRRTYRWLKDGNVNNWRCVCGGGVGTLMLSMMDEFEGDTLEKSQLILQKMLEALRPQMLLWGPLGAFEEGHGYWEFAMSGYAPFIASLEINTGSNFGYVDLPGLNLTNEYLNAITGPAWAFNYHCAGDARSTIYPQMMFLADNLGKYEEGIPRIQKIMESSYNSEADTDILFYNPKMSEVEATALPNDTYFPVSEIATMRTGRGSLDIATFLHCDRPWGVGGADDMHMDAGSFSLQALGDRWFFDLESDDYNISNLKQSYRFRAEGHNTVIFNPDANYAMKKGGNCYISDYRFGDDYSYVVGEMTDAYNPEEGVESFRRGLMLDKKTGIVTLQDEIRVKKPVEMYWFAHTKAVIAISADGKTATLSQGKSFLRAYIVSGEGATFTAMDAVPLPTSPVVSDQNPNKGISKLTIHLENTDDIDLCVVFVPGERLTQLNLRNYTFRNINEWDTISSGEETTGTTDTTDTTDTTAKDSGTSGSQSETNVQTGLQTEIGNRSDANLTTPIIVVGLGVGTVLTVLVVRKKKKHTTS